MNRKLQTKRIFLSKNSYPMEPFDPCTNLFRAGLKDRIVLLSYFNVKRLLKA